MHRDDGFAEEIGLGPYERHRLRIGVIWRGHVACQAVQSPSDMNETSAFRQLDQFDRRDTHLLCGGGGDEPVVICRHFVYVIIVGHGKSIPFAV